MRNRSKCNVFYTQKQNYTIKVQQSYFTLTQTQRQSAQRRKKNVGAHGYHATDGKQIGVGKKNNTPGLS
jgi:deoxyadenosine/deoxycytidine kinase